MQGTKALDEKAARVREEIETLKRSLDEIGSVDNEVCVRLREHS